MDVIETEKRKQIKNKIRKAVAALLDFEKGLVETEKTLSSLCDEEREDIDQGFDHIKQKYHSDNYKKYMDLHLLKIDAIILSDPSSHREKLQFDIDYWKEELIKLDGIRESEALAC